MKFFFCVFILLLACSQVQGVTYFTKCLDDPPSKTEGKSNGFFFFFLVCTAQDAMKIGSLFLESGPDTCVAGQVLFFFLKKIFFFFFFNRLFPS